jgi:RimJ/RimL family protein N-acetyltransferase
MDWSEEAIADEFRRLNFNYPGFNAPLMHRRIRPSDALGLSKVIRNSHKHLKGYIGWAKYSKEWNFRQIQLFVNNHINDTKAHDHFLFLIGSQIVGMGSLGPVGDPSDAQVALWVAEGFHGKGIGTRIVATLEWYAFEVYGFHHLFYQHDATNESSKRLPQKLGYRFSHTFDDSVRADDESGYWFSWIKDRPSGLNDGLLQGAPLEEFCRVRHATPTQGKKI